MEEGFSEVAGAVPSWSGWATYQLGIWFLALRRVEVKKDPGPGLERGGGGKGTIFRQILGQGSPGLSSSITLGIFFFFLKLIINSIFTTTFLSWKELFHFACQEKKSWRS